MVFIESPEFTKEASDIFSEDELFALQLWLVENPEDGDIIPRSGGCRKLRWAVKGRGKRGGARVIYFHRISESQILLIHAYVKNKKADLSAREIKAIKDLKKS
jgi:hypothetical protein